MFRYSKVIGLTVLALASITGALAQGSRNAIPNIDQIRRDFIAAADGKLTLVDDKVERSPEVWGSFRHWLAFVQASSPGIYTVQYSVMFSDESYRRGDRAYEFRVLERGCQRVTQPYISAGNYCLGDTIILPVRLDGYRNHKFTVTKRADTEIALEERRNNWLVDPAAPQPPPTSVANPLAENLEFLGTVRRDTVNRLGSVSVTYLAVFKAIQPGRFSLNVEPETIAGPTASDRSSEREDRAVVIVDRTAPVTFVAEFERTLDYSNYPGVTVGNSNNYQTSTAIVQVGDTIAFPYAGKFYPVKSPPPAGPDEFLRTLRPRIIRRPFQPRIDGFDRWILNYLP